MPTIYGAVDLVKNELRNAAIQNLGSAPSSPVKGQLYYDTTANILYWWNGTAWIAAQSGGSLSPATTVTTSAVGDAPVVGSLATYAREDHKHGREAFGAITAETTFGTSSANGSAATLARSDHTHGNPVHDNNAHTTIALSALGLPLAPVQMNGFTLANVGNPTLATDATNKGYVDNALAGLAWKDAVRVATTANLAALSGLLTIDGVTVAAGDRVLVKNQTTASANGIYAAASGAWSRTTDADLDTELLNATVFVSEGTTQADTAWTMTANMPISITVTALPWVQFAGGGTYTAGNGLTLTGNQFDVVGGTGITVAADLVSVDTTVIATQSYVNTAVTGMARKFAAALTGTASPEVVTHNLNTRDVQVTVLNGASPYTAVEIDWDATTVNTVTVRYNPNLGAGYRCVVVG